MSSTAEETARVSDASSKPVARRHLHMQLTCIADGEVKCLLVGIAGEVEDYLGPNYDNTGRILPYCARNPNQATDLAKALFHRLKENGWEAVRIDTLSSDGPTPYVLEGALLYENSSPRRLFGNTETDPPE